MQDKEEQDLKNLIEKQLHLEISHIERIHGGLVHYVYRIETQDKSIFAKIRKAHYSELPRIPTQPELIEHEKAALEIVSKLEPHIFPQLLAYLPKQHLLLLSDIMPERVTLETRLNTNTATQKEIYELGKIVAIIHKKLSKIKVIIREEGDEAFYNKLLYYRFGYQQEPILNELITTLKTLPKQLILGDLSPKNIGIASKYKFTICDLENFHSGNTITDVGFLGANVLIHTINNSALAYKLLIAFLRGYSSEEKMDIKDINLKRVVLGIALYRIENPVMPYAIPITSKGRAMKAFKIKQVLSNNKISWLEIVNAITFNRNHEN